MTRTDSASTVVPLDAARVFAALLDPHGRERWLPPEGMTGRLEVFDPRPGGGYRMVLTYADPEQVGKSGDHTDVTEVRFVAVDPPHEAALASTLANLRAHLLGNPPPG